MKLKGKEKEVIQYYKDQNYSTKNTALHFGVEQPAILRIISKHMLKKANQMTGTYKK